MRSDTYAYVTYDRNGNRTAKSNTVNANLNNSYTCNTNWAVQTDSGYNWIYGHQGTRFDDVSGLNHHRNRDYSPTLGRWINMDPIRYSAGDVNLYRMVGNNGVMGLDPSGLQEKDEKYDPKNVDSLGLIRADSINGTQFYIYFYKPGNYFYGVLYFKNMPGNILNNKDPMLFGKCKVSPALNVQIPFYSNNDSQKKLNGIIWYNVGAKDEDAQKRISAKFVAAQQLHSSGGLKLYELINSIIKVGVESGDLKKDEVTEYRWEADKRNDPTKMFPKDAPKPPIPSDPVPRSIK